MAPTILAIRGAHLHLKSAMLGIKPDGSAVHLDDDGDPIPTPEQWAEGQRKSPGLETLKGALITGLLGGGLTAAFNGGISGKDGEAALLAGGVSAGLGGLNGYLNARDDNQLLDKLIGKSASESQPTEGSVFPLMGLLRSGASLLTNKYTGADAYDKADQSLKQTVSQGLQGNFVADQAASMMVDQGKAALKSVADGSLKKHLAEQIVRPTIDAELKNTAWGLGSGALAGAGGGYLLHELTRRGKPRNETEQSEDRLKRLAWVLGSAGVGAGVGMGVNRMFNPTKPGALTSLFAQQ